MGKLIISFEHVFSWLPAQQQAVLQAGLFGSMILCDELVW
jgi:hypothetical protein